eukprot:885509-Ditylum_brightwellii.AAC.1
MCKGCTMTDPDKTLKIKCNTDMFVDDAALLHNDKSFDPPATKLMDNIQGDAETWGQLLWASGGLLKFVKSSYFLVIWAFAESGKPKVVPEEELSSNTVKIANATRKTTTLQRVTEQDGIKMLGVKKAATLGDMDQSNYLLDITTTYTRATGPCPLKAHKVWLALVPKLLPQMEYSRTFPSAVVFGSRFSGELGFTHVKAAQMGAKICGTGTPILKETRHLKYLEGNFLSTLLVNMQYINCKVQLHNP